MTAERMGRRRRWRSELLEVDARRGREVRKDGEDDEEEEDEAEEGRRNQGLGREERKAAMKPPTETASW